MSGIMTSRSTRSHSARSQIVNASWPLIAVTTSKYSADSRASMSLTLAGTSSTTRTRAVIRLSLRIAEEMADGLDELAHRDRLAQIGLAATLADALLVALHGEGGHRHDGDGPEILIVLEPLGDFEAGHFGELDVHEDQIGPMLAREIE